MVEEKKVIEIKKEIQSILKKKNELFILNNITVDIITDPDGYWIEILPPKK